MRADTHRSLIFFAMVAWSSLSSFAVGALLVRGATGMIETPSSNKFKGSVMRLHVGVRVWASVLAIFAMLIPELAHAQDFPSRPVRVVVPFSAGGGNDVLARLLAPRMAVALGQPVMIENRPGGGGNIGATAVAHATPDGYTILYAGTTLAVGFSLYSSLSYKLEDLAPISMVGSFPLALTVHPSVAATTVQELVALSRKNKGLNYGSTGIGSASHLTAVLLNNVAGISNSHVPYKGAAPMMTAVVQGEVQFGAPNVMTARPFIQNGQVRPIAVTSLEPLASMPGVPTVASVYPGFNTSLWHGFLAPAGTPAPVIEKLHKAIIEALHDPEMRKSLTKNGMVVVGTTPAEFQVILAEDVRKYGELIRSAGVKPE